MTVSFGSATVYGLAPSLTKRSLSGARILCYIIEREIKLTARLELYAKL